MYDRSKLLSEKYQNLEDGLWVDINYLNDIDYYNTMTSESNILLTQYKNHYQT